MSVFTDAVKAVKAKIEALGSKKFTIENPSKKSSLFQNQLQAVWNIASILEGTMHAKTGEPKSLAELVAYILWYKSTLESSLECLAPGSTKGTIEIPDIPDLNTYQLVIELHELLEVAVAQNSVSGSDVQKLFARIPKPTPSKDPAARPPPTIIDILMYIDRELRIKIELFKEVKRREEAPLLAIYTMRLAELIRPLSPPAYPSCIKDNSTGRISYAITRSTLAAPTARLEADCAAFTALITQLSLYHEALLVIEGKFKSISSERLAASRPIPSEISSPH